SLSTRLTRASDQRWRSRYFMRSKKASAYSSGTDFCSVAASTVRVGGSSKRPYPPRARDGPGLVICPEWSAGADDQLTNAGACRLVRCPPIHTDNKRKPRTCRGFPRWNHERRKVQGSRCPRRSDLIPRDKPGKARIA